MSKRANDSDDDYMSMTFEEAPKPKKQLTYQQKRKLDLEESRRKGTVKSAKEREMEAREEGLKTNVLVDDNKGFGMLAKLGFKKGMKLGRDDALSTRLQEPIAVNIKTGHGGLGMDTHHKEILASSELLADSVVKQSQEEYRVSAAKKRIEAKMNGELMRARKALQGLDEAAGLPRSEMWIPERKQKLLSDDYDVSSIKADVLSSRGEYYKQLATDAELEEESDCERESGFEELETVSKLLRVNQYLRETYFYCVWCGDKFVSIDEMASICPGSTRDDHDIDLE
ncbi:hypothetical protein BDR26DRAFT_587137 [Obelidium mucronatum]|nr:hypothetical protein BDR26DRAFT_587137 [Obelidium mucronatum]